MRSAGVVDSGASLSRCSSWLLLIGPLADPARRWLPVLSLLLTADGAATSKLLFGDRLSR